MSLQKDFLYDTNRKDFLYELYHNILFLSCKFNQEQYLKIALKFKKININEIDSNGLTALIYASKSSDINIVYKLLLKKADVNIRDKYGRTALLRACKNGNLEIVNILLDYGANMKIKGFYWKHNCFDYAYINKHYNIIDCLLDEYVMNISYKDSFRSTVLIWASFRNRLDIVKLLLNCKIHNQSILHNVSNYQLVIMDSEHTKNKSEKYHKIKNPQNIMLHEISVENKTALFYSIDNNNIEIFNKLLNFKKINKSIILNIIPSHNVQDHSIITDTTLSNVHDIMKYEKEAIVHAFLKCNLEIVNKLLKYIKMDVNMKNSNGRHILIQLCKNGNIEIIRKIFNLSSNSIDINMQDIDGKNALMFACENGYFNIVKLILEYELNEIYKESINVNLQDNNGNSALIIASEYGYTNIVEILLKSDIYYKKNKYRTHHSVIQDTSHNAVHNIPHNVNIVQTILHKSEYYSEYHSKYYVDQIDINLQDIMGFTSLSHSCDNGYINISKILLEHEKINLFIKDYYYNKTALEWAVMKKNFIIIDYIILKEKKYYKNIINIILKNKVQEEKYLSLIISLIVSFTISDF